MLPKKGKKKRIQNLKSESATIIIYENKNRLIKTLNNLLEVLGDRPAVVARELTKLHEEIIRGTLAECIAAYINSNKVNKRRLPTVIDIKNTLENPMYSLDDNITTIAIDEQKYMGCALTCSQVDGFHINFSIYELHVIFTK